MGKDEQELDDDEIARRRDSALRRALNTPPKHHKDMKKGKRKIRGDGAPRPIASDEGKRG